MRILGFAALVALAAACTGEGKPSPAAPPRTPTQAPPPTALPPDGPMSLEQAEAELPGFPLRELSPYQRQELVTAAKDEFCHCGCPHTMAGCLKEHPTCRHAARGITLIAAELAAGATRTEALVTTTRYFDSFAPARRKTIDLENVPCLGPADAPVTLVEYSDFECPHCAAARPVLERLVSSRTDTRLCFKQYPLPGHSNAMSAAQATVFAHEHGKFWPLHDLLFENQQRLSPQVIRELVAKTGLDPKELVRAVEDDRLSPVVEKQREEGRSFGIQGTPTIFVNGRMLDLAFTDELLRFTLEDELEWKANGGKWTAD